MIFLTLQSLICSHVVLGRVCKFCADNFSFGVIHVLFCCCFYVQEATKPTKVYKGIHFGRQTSRRMEFGGKEGPGPGEYEPYKPAVVQAQNINIHEEEKVKFESRLPRYHELVVHQEEKKVQNTTLKCVVLVKFLIIVI